MPIKPICQVCKYPFLGGKNGICDACAANRPKRSIRDLRCLCGRKAIIVFLANVLSPEGETMEVEIPICQDCYKLEMELEAIATHLHSPPLKTELNVIVVKSLPRAHPRWQGKRL
jgi:hypothetical protein